jgi:hypothetical protein
LRYVTLGAALGASGCVGVSTTQGQLVVAIQTDVAIPKDIDQIFIEVRVAGNRQYFNEPPLGPDELRLPATITLVPSTFALRRRKMACFALCGRS